MPPVMHIIVRYCAEFVDGNNGIGAEAAEAASARSAQPCITPRKRPSGRAAWGGGSPHDFAPGGRNNLAASARRHCGVWRPTGAEAEMRSFRPRRALRALADGYANGALRALAASRLRSTNPIIINKYRN